jgi:regulator of sigma E protease
MTGVLATTFWYVVILSPLVVIHEFGHFVFAKLFGVRVEAFSIGFGPRLFGVRAGGTDYRVSALPLGGYVKMSGENPDEELTGDPAELGSRPRWQRFVIFVVGALLNIVLAIAVMTVFFLRTGKPVSSGEAPPVVREVVTGSPADQAGVKVGDRLVEVGGRSAADPVVVIEEVFLSPGTTKAFAFERAGKRIEASLEIGYDPKYRSGDPGLRLANDIEEGPPTEETNRIQAVTSGTPAEKAGLLPDDRIVGVDGRHLPSRTELQTLIRQAAGRTITLQVRRASGVVELPIVPELNNGVGRIGIEFAPLEIPREELDLRGAFAESLRFNRENAVLLFVTLKKLVRGDVSLRVMSGPAEIAVAARQAAGLGFDAVLHLIAFISLQLGIINLLPIPMLDGGHIFILLVESILRRDLSAALKERVMQAGLIFLLLFAGIVIYFDVVKLNG